MHGAPALRRLVECRQRGNALHRRKPWRQRFRRNDFDVYERQLVLQLGHRHGLDGYGHRLDGHGHHLDRHERDIDGYGHHRWRANDPW